MDKYTVFKTEQFKRWWDQGSVGGTMHAIEAPDRLEDAVVIRRQDLFSASAFDTYRDSILVAANTLEKMLEGFEFADLSVEHLRFVQEVMERAKKMREIAGYFDEQATLARTDGGGKIPD